MKIKVKEMAYSEVLKLKKEKHQLPKKPNIFFRTLLKIVSTQDLKAVHFSYKTVGTDKLMKGEPALYLMNHSSFIDLKIASSILYPKPLSVVCTSDGFVGKKWLMRNLGCIPTKKFMNDTVLVRDMLYAVKHKNCNILMYPEASYSFDGTATDIPRSLGKCVKMLKIPVVMIRTYGAFARDPLYNNLQLRDTKVSAVMEYIISPDECESKSAKEINTLLKKHFTFDNFKWQRENGVLIKEPFRADGLNRVLYKCPVCSEEGKTVGKGIELVCKACNSKWTLEEDGSLSGEIFDHIPDWYRWERECVREELKNGTYSLEKDVDIYMMVDTKFIYKVGSGVLKHSADGFELTGCNGELKVKSLPTASYSLYSDYYWYEIGDMICIGDKKALYYCFPKDKSDVVAKTRLAAEELYKLKTNN